MRIGRWMAAAAALLGLPGCGPPRQRSLHVIDAGDRVQSLAFAPDGRTLACALSDRILLVDAETGTRLRELGPIPNQHRASGGGVPGVGEVRSLTASLSVAFSHERLLSAGEDDYARLWDVARGVEVDRFETGAVGILATSSDGRWLATRPMQVERGMPDGGVQVVDNPATVTVTIWDLDHRRKSPAIQGSLQPVEALSVSANGLVAVGRSDMTIDIVDAPSAKLVRTLHGDRPYYERLTALAFRPDDPRLLASGDDSGSIRLWDVVKGRLLTRFSTHMDEAFAPSTRLAALSFATGGLLAASGSRGMAELWRLRDRPEREPRSIATLDDYSTLARFSTVPASVEALTVNRNGSLVATSYDDHSVRIWRGSTSR